MNTPANLKWALYLRKSTESEERQIQSLEIQQDLMGEISKRENLNIVHSISESKSAKAPYQREGFQQLLKLIEQGKIDGIICWRLSRLSRNPVDSGTLQWLLQKGKLKCIRTYERIYLPEDNVLLFTLEQGMDNQYVIDLAKNVRGGLEKKANKGHRPGIPDIGYLNSKYRDKGTQEILVDKIRFPIVRKMWDFMLTGNYTQMDIWRMARYEWNLTTPKNGKRGNRPIAPSYIYKIFKSIFYTGYFKYGGKTYKGHQKPMITLDEFERVQQLLGRKDMPRPILHDFPYTGIMKCQKCGASITATEKKKFIKATKEWRTYTYYHCTRRKGHNVCIEPPINFSVLENQLKIYLSECLLSPEFYKLGLEIFESTQNEQSEHREIILANQQKSVQLLQNKSERLLSLLLNGTITEEDYKKQKTEIAEKLVIETAKLQQVDSKHNNYNEQTANTFHFSFAVLHALKYGDNTTKKSILNNFGSNQRIYQKNLYLERFKWFTALKEGEDMLLSKIDLLELRKPNEYNAQMTNSEVFSIVRGTIDDVRRELSKATNPIVPDLSFWAKQLLEQIEKDRDENQSQD